MCVDMKKKEQMVNIGERVKAARIKKGLMPQRLCKRAGLPSVEALNALEAGTYMPCRSRMGALATALSMDIGELMGEEFNLHEETNEAAHAEHVERNSVVDISEKAAITPATLKLMREKLGINQKTAAELCGVGQRTMSYWEKGTYTFPADKMALLFRHYREAMISGKTWKEKSFVLNKEKVISLRNREHMSQKEVAELLGVSNSLVYLWEKGKYKIKESYVKALSECFNVPVQELINEKWEVEETTPPTMDEIEYVEPMPAETDEKQDEEVPALPVSTNHGKTAYKTSAAESIPEEPEKVFCRNVLFYMERENISEDSFETAVGAEVDDFRKTAKTGGKLGLGAMLKAAGFFGKSVEEIVSDDNQHAALLKEREELMARATQLKKILGM